MKLRIPPPIYVLLFGGLMWLLARSPYALPFEVPYDRPIAGLLVLIAIGIDVVALIQFRKSSTTINPLKPEKSSALVTHGIYRYTRNPMYVGMLLLLCAWAVVLGSLSNVLLLAGFVITINVMQIRREEDALKSLFPDDFEDYSRKVRRWF